MDASREAELVMLPPLWLTVLSDRLADRRAVERGDELLARLVQEGLPWNLTLKAAGKKNRNGSWFGFQDAVVMEDLPVLGLPATRWYVRDRGKSELVSACFGDFWIDEDVRANHEHVRLRLVSQLGPGKETSVSNTVEHRWWIGYLRVTARSFPPELQSPSLKNSLHEKYPELRRKTSVEIETAFAHTQPDSALVARYRGLSLPALSVDEAFAPMISAQLSRRHEPLEVDGLGLWCDDKGVALSARRASLVVGRGKKEVVRLTELTPARGGGSATLRFDNGLGEGLPLARCGRHDGLRSLATAAASALDAPLESESFPDD